MSTLTRVNRAIIRLLPFLLIILSLVSVFSYHSLLYFVVRGQAGNDFDFNKAVEIAPAQGIHFSSSLMLLYLSIFITAEGAFILMAIKEYLQDLVGLTEMNLIKGPPRTKIEIKPISL